MANLAIVGAQWGDEGKGKVVDLLAPRFAIVARYQGGPNAGHTVVFDGRSHALRHIPSGIFHAGIRCLVGAGTLVDPAGILSEIEGLEAAQVPVSSRLTISSRAHVIMPYHRQLDAALEQKLGGAAIGTTRRGIGPAYGAKAERTSLRLGDLANKDAVIAGVQRSLDSGLADRLRHFGEVVPDPRQVAQLAHDWWRRLAPMCGDVTRTLHEALEANLPILFEGAQGTMLDVDHGTYPFVTASNTIAGGIPPSLGIPPRAVERTLGVVKAYCTRVGAGPFPTEDHGAAGAQIREKGREFGTVTGRPRRCGWFDAVAGSYAVRLNGLDALAVTKFDVLSGMPKVKIATAYDIDGRRTEWFPSTTAEVARAIPIYEEWDGWSGDLSKVRRLADLPATARRFLDRLSELLRCPVALVSVGPDREETIVDETGLLAQYVVGFDGTRG